MARLYTNENFPAPAVDVLRQLGHDVLTIFDTGHAGQALPDAEVLAYACREGRVLVTLNRRHFVRLHHASAAHTGIIVCTVDLDFAGLAHRIHQALEAQPSLSGQLIRINRPAP